MFDKKTIKDIKIKNKTVLLRADFNVPLHNGIITNDFRIQSGLPTIKFLIQNQAKKIIIISHLGRPTGKRDRSLSLHIVAQRLQELLPNTPVKFVNDVIGPDVEFAVENCPKQGIILLENLRFYQEEEQNSDDFAEEIISSTHADIFVQDGFAVVHRSHASTVAIPDKLPSVAGLLLESEIQQLSKAINHPRKPVLVLIGGSKVEDKQPLIDKFTPIANKIIIGGKIAADGYEPKKPNIIVAADFTADSSGQKLDVGPESTTQVLSDIDSANTIIWNGVFGKTEDPRFAISSTKIAQALGANPLTPNYSTLSQKSQDKTAKTTIICGGDTVGFVQNLQKNHPELQFSLLSTGGGASLEFLLGNPLPGLDILP